MAFAAKCLYMKWRRDLVIVAVSVMVLVVSCSSPTFAFQSSSANYGVDEAFFGTGGELDSSSANYRAKQAAGELTVGNSASANYQFNGGFNTTDTPLLELAVNGGTYDLGILDYGNTSSVQASFTVRNYLSSGYVVLLNGKSPSLADGSHTLAPMSVLANSQTGTEQFGVNVVANTVPAVGANPSQVPDSTFSFGTAVAGYDTPNMFKFADGDTIAMSPKSSGQTNYALSIIANISRSTPAGQYGGHLNVQVVPTF